MSARTKAQRIRAKIHRAQNVRLLERHDGSVFVEEPSTGSFRTHDRALEMRTRLASSEQDANSGGVTARS